MSAGAFQTRFYTANAETIHVIRVQPETASLTIGGASNTGSDGPATPGSSRVRVSGGRRGFGLRARKLYIRFSDEEDMPEGYKFGSIIAVPILQEPLYENSLVPAGQTGTYLGFPIEVVGGSPEGGQR